MGRRNKCGDDKGVGGLIASNELGQIAVDLFRRTHSSARGI